MKDVDFESAARVLHETNRAWCAANGDYSQPEWDEIPDWQLESIYAGIQFHRENPDAPVSASHDSWMKHKINDGWTYGKIKDPDKKTHPCMVPYEDLPEVQKMKDALFKNTVHSLYPSEGEKGLPVKGYRPQSQRNIDLVNTNKQLEELTLQQIDYFEEQGIGDRRWLAIARTQLEQGFMAMNRGIFQPGRSTLDEKFKDLL